MLRLIFIACHPVLATDARVALDAAPRRRPDDRRDRARVPGAGRDGRAADRARETVADRSARAVRAAAGPTERAARLASVLEVLYLIFNEGYSATAGEDWMRPALCEDALRLGRVLARLTPDESEVHGLVALMEIQASRMHARRGPSGEAVLLFDQDRGRWDRLLIGRGLAALERAERCARPLGPYALQASIAAAHARARTNAETDWERIVALYDALASVMPTPVVELNRAVAVGMAFGPEAALQLVDELADEPSLRAYPYLRSVRGDLLAKLGRRAEARAEFERAATLTQNAAEKALLTARARRSDAGD